MPSEREGRTIDRRNFLNGMSMVGAATVAPVMAQAQTDPRSMISQAAGSAKPASSAITVKSVERVAGSSVNYAYAVKAGQFIFLNGHEAYDFEKGLAPEVEGPPGYPLSGAPPLRREADYILNRMRTILKEFGADLPNAVRVDQYYTKGAAVSAYHLARFSQFGGYIPPSTSIIMERCFTGRTNTHTSMVAVAPGPGWDIQKITLPGEAISASGYNPAVVANDFVFVAGNMALQDNGDLPPNVRIRPTAQWGGQTGFRRQVNYCIRERLVPSLKAAGSSLENTLKAQAYIRGTENFPDFMDVWSQNFRDIPVALTVVPAKDYASNEGMIEINLIALKNGSTRKKEVVQIDVPSIGTFGPCVRAGELVFPSGFLPVDRDGRVPAATQAQAFDGLSLAGQAQGALVMSYAEAACKAVGVTSRNIVRSQYFLTDMREFAGVAAAWSDRFGKQPHPFANIQVPGPLPPVGAVLVSDFWIYAG